MDAEQFWNHYAANGWTSNGQPVYDWQALVRKWDGQNRHRQPEGQPSVPVPGAPSELALRSVATLLAESTVANDGQL